jgi:hypothetical protein
MNCTRCHAPLDEHEPFCRACGLATTSTEQTQQSWATVQQSPVVLPTQQIPQQQLAQQGYHTEMSYSPHAPGTFQSAQVQTAKRRRRRGVGGCLVTALTILVLLAIALGCIWGFVVRPYLHDLAVKELNTAFSQAINQIPPQASQLPNGPLNIEENTLNNLITLNTAPSDPVQHTNAQILPGGVQFTFQILGQQSMITGVPQAQNGKLVMTNVTLSGIARLVLSPDDLTSIFNQHLADAQARLNHQILSVQLLSHQMVVVLG